MVVAKNNNFVSYRELAVDLVMAGNVFWEHVMSGQYPESLMVRKPIELELDFNEDEDDLDTGSEYDALEIEGIAIKFIKN